jgi:hypothetical protein
MRRRDCCSLLVLTLCVCIDVDRLASREQQEERRRQERHGAAASSAESDATRARTTDTRVIVPVDAECMYVCLCGRCRIACKRTKHRRLPCSCSRVPTWASTVTNARASFTNRPLTGFAQWCAIEKEKEEEKDEIFLTIFSFLSLCAVCAQNTSIPLGM